MIKLKLLAPLRHENLPNLKNLEEQFANPPYDRGNQYTAAYQWGTLGIYARQAKDKPLPQTWGVLFDPKLQSGAFILIDSVRDMLSNFTQYSSPNKAARPFLRPQDLNNPIIYPPPEIRRKLEFLEDLGAKTRVYDEVWTQVKAR